MPRSSRASRGIGGRRGRTSAAARAACRASKAARQDDRRTGRQRGRSMLRSARPLADERGRAQLLEPRRGAARRRSARRSTPLPTGRPRRWRPRSRPSPRRQALKLGELAQPLRAALTGPTRLAGDLRGHGRARPRRKPGAARDAHRGSRKAARKRCDVRRLMRRSTTMESRGRTPSRARSGATSVEDCRMTQARAMTPSSQQPSRSPTTSAARASNCRCWTARSARTWSTSASSTARPGIFTYDPGFTSTASCETQDHLHRRRQGRPAAPRLPDRAAGRAERLPGGLLPAAQRRAADARSRRPSSSTTSPTTRCCTSRSTVLPRLPPRRAPDGGHVRRGRRAVGLLPRLHRHQRSAAADDRRAPADRQDADDRGDGLQVLDRPAVHVSAQRPQLRRELPAHVFAVPAEDYEVEPGAGAGAWTGSSSCTPTTSRTPRPRRCASPARRAPTRSPASPPASPRLWGPAHGGANEAALNMLEEIGTSDRIPRVHPAREGQERPVPADGLRPPRLQELRPAREGDAARPATRCWTSSASRRPAARAGDGAGEDRAQGRVFRRAQALPERRFLFGHHPARDGLPDLDVHRAVRGRPHGRLDRAVERDDRGPDAEDRPSAPALHRPHQRGYVPLPKRG